MSKPLDSLERLRAAFRKPPTFDELSPAFIAELEEERKRREIEEAPYVLEQKAQHEHDEEDSK